MKNACARSAPPSAAPRGRRSRRPRRRRRTRAREPLLRRLRALHHKLVGVLDARVLLHDLVPHAAHTLLELRLLGAADADELRAALLPGRFGLAVLLDRPRRKVAVDRHGRLQHGFLHIRRQALEPRFTDAELQKEEGVATNRVADLTTS